MDRMDPHELLSAYLDGEVSPTERAEAEQLLENSPELRGDLDDFARLSDLIRGLPRESAPSELAAAIRQQAERQSLLGPEATTPKRSFRREILSALIGMAATVVGMLLITQTVDRGEGHLAQNGIPAATFSIDHPEPVVTAQADRDSSQVMDAASAAPDAIVMERQFDAKQAGESQRELLAGAAPATDPLPGVPTMAAPPLAAKSGAPRMAAAKKLPELAKSQEELRDGTSSAAQFGGAVNHTGRLAEAAPGLNWSSVRMGDVVPYFERNGNGVAVLEATVVDIEQTENRIEVLLKRYNVPVIEDHEETVDGDQASESKRTARRSNKKEKSVHPDELVTVYLELPSSDLAGFLNDMDEQGLFLTAQLQPPVDVPPQIEAEQLNEQLPRNRFEQNLPAQEAEQIVKQEAAEATNQYALRKSNTYQALADEGDSSKTLPQKPGATSALRRAPADGQAARGGANLKRNLLVQADKTGKQDAADDQPTDALIAMEQVPQTMNSIRQRNSIAVKNMMNTTNTTQNLQMNNSIAAGKQSNNAAEKSAASAPAEADHELASKDRASDEAWSDEPPPSPTVRLLLVLQQASGAPQE